MMQLSRSKADGSVVYTMDRTELEDRISYGHWRPRRKKAPLHVAMSRKLVPKLGYDCTRPIHFAVRRPKRSGLWNAWRSVHGGRVWLMTQYLIELMDGLVGREKYDRSVLTKNFEQMCYDTFNKRELAGACVQHEHHNLCH